MFDLTISLGNIISIIVVVVSVILYIVDTRYSTQGARVTVERLTKVIEELSIDVRQHAADDVKMFEAVRRETGETVAAIREKIREVELFTRDNFVRNDSLANMNVAIQNVINQLTDIKTWLGRIEGRMETKVDKQSPRHV
jgi:hypothetical protein